MILYGRYHVLRVLGGRNVDVQELYPANRASGDQGRATTASHQEVEFLPHIAPPAFVRVMGFFRGLDAPT